MTVAITFSEHMAKDRIAGMVSLMAPLGIVTEIEGGREFKIEVFRSSQGEKLQRFLTHWEASGFCRYAPSTVDRGEINVP
jgi:hypothetical protein